MTEREPFGRTQLIAIGVLAGPFVMASAFVWFGKMTPTEWSGFIQFLALSVAVPFFGIGAAHKVLTSRAETPATEEKAEP